MKNLSKADYARRDEIIGELQAIETEVEAAFADLQVAVATYNQRVAAYNEVVAEGTGWVEDIASTIEAYMDERSDKWREGERGGAYQSWLTEWQGFQLDELELVEDPTAPDLNAASALEEGLPPEEVAE